MRLLDMKIPHIQSCSICGNGTNNILCTRCELTLKLMEKENWKNGVLEANTGKTPVISTPVMGGAKPVNQPITAKFITSATQKRGDTR